MDRWVSTEKESLGGKVIRKRKVDFKPKAGSKHIHVSERYTDESAYQRRLYVQVTKHRNQFQDFRSEKERKMQ